MDTSGDGDRDGDPDGAIVHIGIKPRDVIPIDDDSEDEDSSDEDEQQDEELSMEDRYAAANSFPHMTVCCMVGFLQPSGLLCVVVSLLFSRLVR
jgi:hypothetical protein